MWTDWGQLWEILEWFMKEVTRGMHTAVAFHTVIGCIEKRAGVQVTAL